MCIYEKSDCVIACDLPFDQFSCLFFKWNSNPTDYSAIVLILLSQIDYVNFINSIRLTKTLRLSSPITEGRKPNMPKKNARETKMARTQLIEM